MIVNNTPVEDHLAEFGLLVKREDLSCPPPGPPFSKTRGVYAHILSRPEHTIGVLDTRHSQGGHAVARACQLLGKRAVVYYPEFKNEPGWRAPQERAKELGADLVGLPAGRSAILYHAAKKHLSGLEGYMMPNALKLQEMVVETTAEVVRTRDDLMRVENVLVSASSATIAAGVSRGLHKISWFGNLIIHLGYSRSQKRVDDYMASLIGMESVPYILVDEGYAYADVARAGVTPPWPCNVHYDLKAFRWWLRDGRRSYGDTLLWNIG